MLPSRTEAWHLPASKVPLGPPLGPNLQATPSAPNVRANTHTHTYSYTHHTHTHTIKKNKKRREREREGDTALARIGAP